MKHRDVISSLLTKRAEDEGGLKLIIKASSPCNVTAFMLTDSLSSLLLLERSLIVPSSGKLLGKLFFKFNDAVCVSKLIATKLDHLYPGNSRTYLQ